ncbi:MAG: hypothetical protein H6537_02295 [Bacteroidales bacterium]|nr:hypothetical protein [Bacteroidales bacterium]
MRNKYFITTIIAFLAIVNTAFTQNLNTYSPYSRFGIGIIPLQGFGINTSLGGVSQGIRNPYEINFLNPASYSAQDSMSFLFDFGVQTNTTSFKGYDQYLNEQSATNSAGGIHHIAIGFPITKKWGVSAGITPYSNVGFRQIRFETSDSILSTIGRVKYENSGAGGITNAYIGTGVSPFRNFSIGANMIYYFGSLDYNTNIIMPNTAADYSSGYVKSSFAINDISFSVGAQYKIDLDKHLKNSVVLGITADCPSNINYKRIYSATVVGSSISDTLTPHSTTSHSFKKPLGINSGIAFYHSDNLIIAFDYYVQDWSETEPFNTEQPLGKAQTFKGGIQYTPNPTDLKSYFKKVNYRIGGYYNKSSIMVNSKQIDNYGITFGLGLPLKGKTRLNLSFEIGQRGTNDNYLIKETYGVMNLSISFYDYPWFFKRKYN